MFDKEMLGYFLEDLEEVCEGWVSCCIALQENHDPDHLNGLFRAVHTLKGNISTLPNAEELINYVHDLEETLELRRESNHQLNNKELLHLLTVEKKLRSLLKKWDGESQLAPSEEMKKAVLELKNASTPATKTSSPAHYANTSVEEEKKHSREDVELAIRASQLTEVLDLLQETLTHHEIIEKFFDANKSSLAPAFESVRIAKRSAEQVRRKLSEVRSEDLKNVFSRLKRAAIETSIELDKPIQVRTRGTHIQIDREIVKSLMNPLLHLVRNAVDHGVESKQERLSQNKEINATIEFEATQLPHSIEIKIRDDGSGIDLQAIRTKAIEKGILREEEEKDGDYLKELLFHPGFSTKAAATTVSGRGVGLDVVRENVTQLGGNVSILSTPKKGTEFTIRLPSKATLTKVVVCSIGSKTVAFPLSEIEAIQIKPDQEHKKVSKISYMNTIVPITKIHTKIGEAADADSELNLPLIICRTADGIAGGIVDRVIGQRKVGIKKSKSDAAKFPCFLGWAFFDEGRPISVLSMKELLSDCTHHLDDHRIESA